MLSLFLLTLGLRQELAEPEARWSPRLGPPPHSPGHTLTMPVCGCRRFKLWSPCLLNRDFIDRAISPAPRIVSLN